jgi:hypothetical protein
MKLKITMLKLVKLILIEEELVDQDIPAKNLVKHSNVVLIKTETSVIELNK